MLEMPDLTIMHWVYLTVLLTIIVLMVFKKDVVVPSLLGIFIMGLMAKGSLIGGAQTIFKALLVAGTDLFDIMLVISLMVAMLKSMQSMGADYLMIAPAKKLMSKPVVAFWGLALIMYLAATFFWPTPATALVGTILLPVAISAGLSPMAAAQALNLSGHGTALSGDLVLQGAPAITAKAAGVDVSLVLTKGVMFGWITGIVALSVAFFMLRKEIFSGKPQKSELISEERSEYPGYAKFFAALVPIVFFTIVIMMIRANLNPDIPGIKGGDATALLGGAAALILLLATLVHHKVEGLVKIIGFLREGFTFAIKIFTPVIAIAGFFYIGSPGNAARILGVPGTPGYLFDLGSALANVIPLSAIPLAFGIVIVSLLTGLDGSGFSGLPLVGALAAALGQPTGVDVATLAALGQVAAIWAGGGTLTAWAFGVVADAGIAGVRPIDLVRRNFLAVIGGLFISTVVAIMIM